MLNKKKKINNLVVLLEWNYQKLNGANSVNSYMKRKFQNCQNRKPIGVTKQNGAIPRSMTSPNHDKTGSIKKPACVYRGKQCGFVDPQIRCGLISLQNVWIKLSSF